MLNRRQFALLACAGLLGGSVLPAVARADTADAAAGAFIEKLLRDLNTMRPLIAASLKAISVLVIMPIFAAGVLSATKATSAKDKDPDSEKTTMQIGYSISTALLFGGIIIVLVLFGRALFAHPRVLAPSSPAATPLPTLLTPPR